MSDTIRTTAAVDLQAAKGKPPRVSIVAYGGGVMDPPGYGPTIVDTAGCDVGSVTLLVDHANKINGVAGRGVASIVAGRIVAEGELADTAAARDVLALHKSGVTLEASVGLDVLESRRLRAGESVVANGRKFTVEEPTLLVTKARLKEISFTPVGADRETAVSIAASQGREIVMAGELNNGVGGTAVADPVAHERERIGAIHAAARECNLTAPAAVELTAQAIDEGWSVDRYKSRAFDLLQKQHELDLLRASRPEGRAGGRGMPAELPHRELMAAAVLMHAGQHKVAEASYAPQILEASRVLAAEGLPGIARAALQHEGKPIPGNNSKELLATGFTTMSLPVALGDAANKHLEQQFLATRATWRLAAGIKSGTNFHNQTGVRMAMGGKLDETPPDGEIRHAKLDEMTYSWKLGTFTKMISLTRTAIINDDLGFVNDIPKMLATMAARTLSDKFWVMVNESMAPSVGAGVIIADSLGNRLSGASSVLSIDSLAAAVRMMREQTDTEDNPIDVAPATLIVGPSNETAARSILRSQTLSRDASGDLLPEGNPLEGIVNLEVEPRIKNTYANRWYLFGDPNFDPAYVVGFLNGNEYPVLDMADAAFNKLGQEWRCVYDFGVAGAEHRAVVGSNGG